MTPAQDTKGCEYGEPWTVEAGIKGPYVELIRRAAMCVNACAGIPDPSAFISQARLDAEAVKTLRSALNGLLVGLMMDHPTFAIGLNDWQPVIVARQALAAGAAK